MKLNKLLDKQLHKFLPESCREKEEFRAFINAVNSSYNSYEKEIELSERAFGFAEEEYHGLNEQLKQEIAVKELSINKLKDTVKAIEGNSLPANDTDNELLSIASYLKKQIASRQDAEQKLKEQKAFYERVLNQIPADIAIIDKEYRYLFVNPSAIKNPEVRAWIIGKTEEEYRIYRNKPLTGEIERRKHFDDVVASKKKKEWEEQIVTPGGSIEYHLRILHPVFNDEGAFEFMVIYGFNITERKQIEEQVRISETRYKSIFDNSQALICTHDLDGVVLDVNGAAEKAFEYTKQELIHMPLQRLLPEDKRGEFEYNYLNEIKMHGKASGIMIAKSKTGKTLYLLYQNFLVKEQDHEGYVIGFSQDITARIEADRALKKSEEKYRSIIANMNLGLLEVNEAEQIVYANNSFCGMSGYEQEELIGENATKIFLGEANRETGAHIRKRRREGRSDAYELHVKNKRGELRWWLISGAPLIAEDGSFNGSIGIHLDITSQKQQEAELRQAKVDAENAARAKEQFLANVSHEIRTPMNAILGIGGLLAKTQLNEQQSFYLTTIRKATNNLLVIINDLLDFSKIESGKVSLEYIGFSLSDTLQNAFSVLKHKAEEKNLSLVAYCDPDISPVVIGDPYRINQVLMNLLSNALKFTEQGTITVSCKLDQDGPGTQKIAFHIRDTGIGIGEDFLEHLFDDFSQEDKSVTRKFGGTGLGMSITRQLVELMGGRDPGTE